MNYRQQILEALQAKFKGGNAGVLGWIATQLAKTVTAPEQVQAAVDGITQEYVTMMEGYGDSRATSSAQTAVKNYETQHGIKDGKPVEDPEKGKKNDPVTVTEPPTGGAHQTDDVPEWAKQILANQKTITDRLNQNDLERTTTSRRQQISQIIAKLPENLRKPYERMSLDSLKDEEFNQLVTDITSEVETVASELKQSGAVFKQPTGGQGGTGAKATDAEVEAVIGKLNI